MAGDALGDGAAVAPNAFFGGAEHAGFGVGVAENVSKTGVGVGHVCTALRNPAPETRQPPADPVSPELLHAAVAAAKHRAAATGRTIRITISVTRNGKDAPPAEGPQRLVLMTARRTRISRAQARRIALAAQRFGVPPPAKITAGHLRRMIEQLGAVQIDSVNVLVRSHFLPAFSRMGCYDRTLLERVAYKRPRRVFEYWGHEASLLPVHLFPLLRWRMERSRNGEGVWDGVARVGRERGDLLARVRETIAERGPMSASDLEHLRERRSEKRGAGWWSWDDTKRAVEFLFWCGEITPLARRSSFERVYDLTERVIPPDVFAKRVKASEAYAQLVDTAARALGIAVESDLRDYFRLPVAAAKDAIARLVECEQLIPVQVEGWKQQAYLHADARFPRRIETSALISPFDSLVWNRERTKRLFDFHYRIEIYTPSHKRVHGYYVLPYLLDEALVARVDLKADRAGGALMVHAVHYEPGVDRRAAKARLNEDLQKMARWLGLERVKAPR